MNACKQSILWLIALIILIVGITFFAVSLIETQQAYVINIITVSCLVTGLLFLSIFTRIQNSEYAYPIWCVFIVVIGLTFGCQLLMKYWDPLLLDKFSKNRYWFMMAEPYRVYTLTLWTLIAMLILMACGWLLLRLTKPFVIFGFYELSEFPVMVAFAAWTIGLDVYQAPTLIQTLGYGLADYWQASYLSEWFVGGVLLIFILIKITVALLFQQRWMDDIKRLVWVALTIWILQLLTNTLLTDLKILLENYLDLIGFLISYYLFIVLVSLLVFQLFFYSIKVRKSY